MQVSVTFPFAVYNELEELVKREKRWFSEPDFIREAVNEKLQRWKHDHPPKA